MAATTSIRLTKPRISAMILEGTALAVSVTLMIWLFFWFLPRRAQKNQVEAFYVQFDDAPDESPFQAADVRRFRSAPESGEVRETRAGDLKEAVLKAVGGGGGSVVIFISAPMLGQGADRASEPIRDLIGSVASQSKRNAVLLALDVAQVDTDRELGLYGVSPYAQIAKATEELGPSGAKVLVMTSAGPAQKSWSADGLGQSIFAYYLREGLEGKARGWDEKQPNAITVAGLHAYVRRHVAEWARGHRHSVQTPMLLPESARAADAPAVVLRAISPGAPQTVAVASTAPAADSQAKAGTQDQSAPAAAKDAAPAPLDPWKPLLDEWKEHDTLRGRKPYRYLPGAWRAYQATLLRAERSLRAAQLDPQAASALDRARRELDNARDRRVELAKKLERWLADEDGPPYRSVIGEAEGQGKRELDEALAFLTGQGSDDAELIPPPRKVTRPATEPAKADDPPPAAPKAAKGPPAALLDITPATYLELQLPAWAHRFEIRFQQPHFFRDDEARKLTLRELVRARADAERALELDRRGLGWILPVIARGDEVRREIQDELLSGARQDRARPRWRDRVERVRSLYTMARRRGEEFRRARDTWEEAAAELPSLVEWAVRRHSFRSNPARSPADAIPGAAGRALEAFDRLAHHLRTRTIVDDIESDTKSAEWFRDLKTFTDDARKSLDDLRDQFADVVGNVDVRDWTAVDAALRAPLIPYEKRGPLLSRSPLQEQPVTLQPGSGAAGSPGGEADRAADPGFWVRAAGLARLDLTLSRIARDLTNEDDAPGFKELKTEWQRAEADSAGGRPDDSSRDPNITAAVRKAALDIKGTDPPAEAGQPRTRKEAEPALAELDRLARLLDAWQFGRARTTWIDEAAARYWRFGRFAALAFHLDRLRQDYADSDTLGNLFGTMKEAADSVPVQLDLHSSETASPSLRPDFKSRQVRLKKWEGTLDVLIRRPGEGEGPVPPGQAFVGVIVPTGLEITDAPPDSVVPGRLVKVGGPRLATSDDAVGTYGLLQRDYATSHPYEVSAVAFYRGRVNDDSVATADILPGPDKDPVTITIAADKEAWKRKYDGANIDAIQDQFEKHQDRGFMHLGGSLGYLLAVRNQFPMELKVECVVKLTDGPNAQADQGEELFNDVLLLGRRGGAADHWTFSNKISLNKDKPDETRVLKVSLKLVNPAAPAGNPQANAWAKEFKVTFSQVDVTKYMEVRDRFEPQCFNKQHDPGERCYIVAYARRGDDPFTEPIRADKWRCQIVDLPAVAAPVWIQPGSAGFEFHYHPANRETGNYPWSGWIENEEIAGNVNQWGPKPKK